jgi:hypothetical protein
MPRTSRHDYTTVMWSVTAVTPPGVAQAMRSARSRSRQERTYPLKTASPRLLAIMAFAC